jgi:hypothetical protein
MCSPVQSIGSIQSWVEEYRQKYNNLPSSLTVLVEKERYVDPEDLLDPWEQPFQYDAAGKRNGGRRPDIWTVTPDRRTLGNWPVDKK